MALVVVVVFYFSCGFGGGGGGLVFDFVCGFFFLVGCAWWRWL